LGAKFRPISKEVLRNLQTFQFLTGLQPRAKFGYHFSQKLHFRPLFFWVPNGIRWGPRLVGPLKDFFGFHTCPNHWERDLWLGLLGIIFPPIFLAPFPFFLRRKVGPFHRGGRGSPLFKPGGSFF